MKDFNKSVKNVAYLLVSMSMLLAGCGGSGDNSDTDNDSGTDTGSDALDISNAIFSENDADCATYSNSYEADVTDIQRSMGFALDVVISNDTTSCTFSSNNIPNHDFNDASANFATPVSEVSQTFVVTRTPVIANSPTAFTQRTYNAVMLNGVPLDILSAGCYMPTSAQADADGNVAIGCRDTDPYLLDPLGTESKFGADAHNAHTQPDGSYHYHGNPNAMFDESPGPKGSPVIGFAADGFPIYGSYFLDPATGTVRKAISGYTLKSGSRGIKSNTNPGGTYDGTYTSDWEFTGAGDLDSCNGMTVNGQYGYYVTDTYPWVMRCFTGTPNESFNK
ncbi:MAG: YHYH protein [Gammaproteobacteria bacterium]|nr:YHYH protein [Gammaproteobacteria bacterium]